MVTDGSKQAMTNRIELRVDGNQWVAQWIGPHAAKTVELFGTDTLPTPYSTSAPAAVVLAQVMSLNPCVDVTLAGGR
jgi:hypothetical protein